MYIVQVMILNTSRDIICTLILCRNTMTSSFSESHNNQTQDFTNCRGLHCMVSPHWPSWASGLAHIQTSSTTAKKQRISYASLCSSLTIAIITETYVWWTGYLFHTANKLTYVNVHATKVHTLPNAHLTLLSTEHQQIPYIARNYTVHMQHVCCW